MQQLIQIVIYIVSAFSAITIVASTLGLLRFNDTYKQIHIGTIIDMVTVPLIFIVNALIFFKEGNIKIGLKLLTLTIVWYILNPITNYCMIKIVHFYSKKEEQAT